jgi:hypothetical protein
MQKVNRIKGTNQIVYPVEGSKGGHTLCLFPYDKVSKKGHRGVLQYVKDSKLEEDNRYAVLEAATASAGE